MRSELQQMVEGLDFVPKRLPRSGVFPARAMLQRDGAVILTGWPLEPDSAVTAADVDVTSRIPSPDVHPPPQVCRLIEWTRGGRRIVRTPDYAQPAPRETRREEHEQQINAYADLMATLTAQIQQDTTLAAGEALILDNYRCLHGVRVHHGTRTTHVLRCRSADAW